MSSPAKFIPPVGSKFFVGTDSDGDAAAEIAFPTPGMPGVTTVVGPDGSPFGRPLVFAREISREEFKAWLGADSSHTPASG